MLLWAIIASVCLIVFTSYLYFVDIADAKTVKHTEETNADTGYKKKQLAEHQQKLYNDTNRNQNLMCDDQWDMMTLDIKTF